MTASFWYLVFMAGAQYIGPLPQEACQMASVQLRAAGVTCRQATALAVCPVPDVPGVYTTCPKFDFPQVTIK